MKKLPVGIQSFRELRAEDYLYVDKTEHLYNLSQGGKYYFLSRPRRFGKSLLVNTLAELFKGHKAPFEGLWIEDRWDWSQTHPVIQIGFSSMGYKSLGLHEAITKRLEEQARAYDIALKEKGIEVQFRELITKLFEKHGRVVILIDEYDKPIIDFLEDPEKAKAQRDILKTFYSVLKDADDWLRLVFITGVSKFSRTSIFSELNNLTDLTMMSQYATMLGYTQEELERSFADRIEDLSEQFGGRESLMAQIRDWYNGYSWNKGGDRVYNPFSVLSFFNAKDFNNFWFTSGTPTFLIKLLKQHGVYELDQVEADNSALESFDMERLSPETILFQTGYITIQEDMGFGLYKLGYPNREVRESMLIHLTTGYRNASQGTGASPALRMAHALAKGNLDGLITNINALLAGIPYDWHQSNEAYYHTIMHLAFSLIGVHIQSELHTAKGRTDSVIHTGHTTYVLEFKVDQTAEEALIQIEKKGYAEPYRGKGKPIVAVGINFSTEKREVVEWDEREVK